MINTSKYITATIKPGFTAYCAENSIKTYFKDGDTVIVGREYVYVWPSGIFTSGATTMWNQYVDEKFLDIQLGAQIKRAS